jgi:hypothetical protein
MSNDATLDTFFRIVNDKTFAHYHDVGYLMNNVFCPDTPTPNPKYPYCGITDHGPQFVGGANITILFTELFTSFKDFHSTPLAGAPRLYSLDQSTIGIQTTLTGTQLLRWFDGHPALQSPPLSCVKPDKLHSMSVPACSVCVFDANNRIMQLAIYTDRYRMIQQLTPPPPPVEAIKVVSLIEGVLKLNEH